VQQLEKGGAEVHIYPDAEEWIQSGLVQQRLRELASEIRERPAEHPLRTELLDAELLPYQLDGIAFAVGAGRAILADEMGLGKTIQAIGVAELLQRWAEIERVLVICPASLKSQWRDEIIRFAQRDCQIVAGSADQRWDQYRSGAFYTICNYEQILRDLSGVESAPWDLIILDEGQRIKNWESKTSRVVRALRSRFALVLSGTPLENRLDELYTITQFVDEHRLGPAYRFFHRHREVDERGKVVAYREMDVLRENLRPILLRRTRAEVAREMPNRIDQVVRIAPTAEQKEISDSQLNVAARIANKRFLTEMDLLRLQKALLMARMSADSTFLVDKQEPEYSSKLERLHELLGELLEAGDRKIVIFSEWTTMLDRITMRLEQLGCDFVRLDGGVPQKRRPSIIRRFQNDPDCRVILMTNAGSTGLNLQAANTVINVDLPWNPAVLEQRIARAYRMGQTQPVHVYKLVTEKTIEERLLDTLVVKQGVADAALDVSSDVERLDLVNGISDLRQKLEQVLGPKPAAPVDESQKRQVEAETEAIRQRRERVSAAGGELVGAALKMVGELMRSEESPEPDPQAVDTLHSSLGECVERDGEGKPQLRISLPNDDALKDLAQTLARLLG
jgi:SNF2 family DNA or RNA helicase